MANPIVSDGSEKPITLIDAVDAYIARYENPHTSKNYKLILLPLAAALGPDRPVADVTKLEVRSYFVGVAMRLKPSTKSTYASSIKAFFNWLVQSGHIETSPARGLLGRGK